VTSVGRLFHKRLPATGKARSATVTSLVDAYLCIINTLTYLLIYLFIYLLTYLLYINLDLTPPSR